MRERKYTLDQLQDFCKEHSPYEVKEKTRNIFISLLQSDFFNSMDTLAKVAFVEYFYQIEDILLGAFDDLNLEINEE